MEQKKPKERAKELFNKYYEKQDSEDVQLNINKAKEYALIAVEAIIHEVVTPTDEKGIKWIMDDGRAFLSYLDILNLRYWRKVVKEIKKI